MDGKDLDFSFSFSFSSRREKQETLFSQQIQMKNEKQDWITFDPFFTYTRSGHKMTVTYEDEMLNLLMKQHFRRGKKDLEFYLIWLSTTLI